MRYGIISDIHSNLEALSAVLTEIKKLKVDGLLCLGDIVGYGANPRECLDIIRQLKMPTVAGNHDWAVGGRLDASYFTEDGKAAIMTTRPQMGLEDMTFLTQLPLELKNKELILVHGSPKQPEMFHYLNNMEAIAQAFAHLEEKLCFVGHTHVPGIYLQHNGTVYEHRSTEVELNDQVKTLVNVGSVGQPRDGNPMASFGLYDAKLHRVELRRIPYDVATAQKKILQAGLPSSLAERLAGGN